MPKFFVLSRQVRRVVVADDPIRAARDVVLSYRDELERLGELTFVSECGFDIEADSTVVLTAHLLDNTDI